MAGLYIHIPFCEKKCRYCDFYSITNLSYIDDYINALIEEFNLYTEKNKTQKITSIFIGGGTPSVLNSHHIESITKSLYNKFDIAKNVEFTIESNPKTLNYDDLSEYRNIGINRLSIGIQSLNSKELNFLGRIHNGSEALKSIEEAQKAGFDNINADVIFAIPGQTIDTLTNTIQGIVDSGVNHISAYSLIYEKGTPLYKDYLNKKFRITDDEKDYDFYNLICKTLKKNNFNHYEISNFSKKQSECKHNMIYWQKDEYYGFGTAAHSFYDKKRISNISNVQEYIRLLNQGTHPIKKTELLTKSEILIEQIFLGLRSTGLDINKLSHQLKPSKMINLNTFLKKSITEDIAIMQEGLFKLSDKGYFICDEIVLNILDIIE